MDRASPARGQAWHTIHVVVFARKGRGWSTFADHDGGSGRRVDILFRPYDFHRTPRPRSVAATRRRRRRCPALRSTPRSPRSRTRNPPRPPTTRARSAAAYPAGDPALDILPHRPRRRPLASLLQRRLPPVGIAINRRQPHMRAGQFGGAWRFQPARADGLGDVPHRHRRQPRLVVRSFNFSRSIRRSSSRRSSITAATKSSVMA